jgi:hypothetical protein
MRGHSFPQKEIFPSSEAIHPSSGPTYIENLQLMANVWMAKNLEKV